MDHKSRAHRPPSCRPPRPHLFLLLPPKQQRLTRQTGWASAPSHTTAPAVLPVLHSAIMTSKTSIPMVAPTRTLPNPTPPRSHQHSRPVPKSPIPQLQTGRRGQLWRDPSLRRVPLCLFLKSQTRNCFETTGGSAAASHAGRCSGTARIGGSITTPAWAWLQGMSQKEKKIYKNCAKYLTLAVERLQHIGSVR